MIVPIFCLVCLIFLSWVLLLKMEIKGLKQNVERLTQALNQKLKNVAEEVKVSGGRRLTRTEDAAAPKRP